MKKKMLESILNEIEQFGECFIGTMDVQGMKAYKRYQKVAKAFEENHPRETLAYDSHTGMVWITE